MRGEIETNAGYRVADGLGRAALAVVAWLLRHWLLLIAAALAVYVALPLAAPLLLRAGHERAGQVIHLLFRPLCHQLPERSFFLYGEQAAYSIEVLVARLGGQVPPRYTGDPVLGYKMAVCQRDVAIYGAMLLGVGLYALGRRWLHAPANWVLALAAAPMGLDGGGQLIGLWESSPPSRVLTGAVFGLGLMWWALPRLGQALEQASVVAKDQ